MTSSPSPDDALAAALLPRLEDLLGVGWVADEDEADDRDGGSDGGPWDDGVPDGFPEHALVAGDEVGFTLPDVAGLYAFSSVFIDRASASIAWSMVNDASFADRFVSSIAAGAIPRDGTELLGPVMRPVEVADLDGASVGARVVMFSSADDRAVRPLALRVAAISAGRVLVLVWSVDRGDHVADRRWQHVVERTAVRVGRG